MPIPKSLEALMDHGVVEQVVRPLLSGKEAEVFLVLSEGAYRVAKVYKDAQHRSFRNRATYTEGRRVRNSRDQRAMAKRTNHGKARDEAAWRSTEVDMIYKLTAAGVRVPTPYHFVDGILIMELVSTAAGDPAPRLGELSFTPTDAQKVYDRLMTEVVRMLCAGVVHGDLSEFNVLMGHTGPCIIDFPQSVNAAGNANARKLLLRDVNNLHRFIERFVPNRRRAPYGEEMWQLYEKGELAPDTRLTGRYTPAVASADVDVVMAIIEEAKRDERLRQQRMGEGGGGYARKKSAASAQAAQAPRGQAPRPGDRQGHRAPRGGGTSDRQGGHPPRHGGAPDRQGRGPARGGHAAAGEGRRTSRPDTPPERRQGAAGAPGDQAPVDPARRRTRRGRRPPR